MAQRGKKSESVTIHEYREDVADLLFEQYSFILNGTVVLAL